MASSTSTLALSDAPPAAAAQVINVEEVAKGARKGSRKLQDMSSEERSAVLMQIASSLELREQEILTANMIDVEAAENRWGRNLSNFTKMSFSLPLFLFLLRQIVFSICFTVLSTYLNSSQLSFSGLPGTTLSRLKLTSQKIKTLVEGIRSIAKQEEPIGEVSGRR